MIRTIATLIVLSLITAHLCGCQSYTKVEYYDPPQFGPDGLPLVKTEEKRDGIAPWSPDKTFIATKEVNMKPQLPEK
ncbi:hypothetical protein DRO66_05905 [Candidatus Bathyarchaeota archaeon]|nr:MAG: hypothetical protein DRO66_05905 [Candidatus Bathyarchaeota archaeon]